MNRRHVAALAVTGISLAALFACSASPEESAATSPSTNEALTITCTAPFTYYSPQVWHYPESGHPYLGPGCKSAVAAPAVSMDPPPPSTAIAPPSSLASQGCTYGMDIQSLGQWTNVWACPTTTVDGGALVVPSNLGAAPTCAPPEGPCECEVVTADPKVTDNAYFGSALTGWTLVFENMSLLHGTPGDCKGDQGGGCPGGCAWPQP